jgi:hemerythrin-like domain-containing protein
MQPTTILSEEHRVIEVVLDCLDQMTRRALESGRLDGPSATSALDFLRNFADRCHHGKEEDLLFPALTAKGMPRDQGPVGVMLSEHEQGRALIRRMAESIEAAAAGDRAAVGSFADSAADYVELLRAHIQKEDRILFPMAGRFLDDGEQAELLKAFSTVETEHMGAGTHEKYLALARSLAEKFDVAHEALETHAGHCCHH